MRYLAAIALFFFLKPPTAIAQHTADSSFQKKDKKAERPLEIETLLLLKNGGQVRGKLTEWVPGEYVVLTTYDSINLKLTEEYVLRIKQFRYGGPPVLRDRKTYDFIEKGRYYSLNLGMVPGFNSSGFGDYGPFFLRTFTFSASTGWQLSRLGGLGMGIGLDKYGNSGDMTIVPIFLDVRGYLLRSPRTPYFNLMLGHGFASSANFNEGSGVSVTEKKGGLFISPNIGLRLGARRHGNFTVDFGARFQRCSFQSTGFGGGPFTKGIDYRRYTLRAGMVF